MRRPSLATSSRRSCLVAALLALVACGAPPDRAPPVTDGPTAVRAVLDTSVASWNRGDLDAHVAVYADSATLLPGAAGRGPAQARRTLAAFFAVPATRPQLALDSLQLLSLGATYVLARGQYVLVGGHTAVPRRGWFTEVWARTPEGWRIIHDHSS